jgi:hypothetical protein
MREFGWALAWCVIAGSTDAPGDMPDSPAFRDSTGDLFEVLL